MNSVFDPELVAQAVEELKIQDLAAATIGQVVLLAQRLETQTGERFIRMDQGVPGLEPCHIGIRAEKEALDRGVAAIYPAAEGVGELKVEAARFIKAFIDVDISPLGCIPVVGSVEGSFGAFIATTQLDAVKNRILFIDPGFPIQKSQLRIIGAKWEQFDIYEHRGAEKLRAKLEDMLAEGTISAIVYSNPNNPSWICLDQEELKVIGELATAHDVIVIEDLAYFCMDRRQDLSHPFRAPFQASVANYTDNYILMLSGSKIFSYAGQRIAVLAVSDKLFARSYATLAERYATSGHFGPTLTAAILYMISSGATHSTQYGLAAMFKASSDGEFDFVQATVDYADRAQRMKRAFEANGFYVVYQMDVHDKVGDGFFFTIGYPGMTSGELMRELIFYGITSITLTTTGSEQQGIRACTSRMSEDLFPVLEERLAAFAANH